MTPHHAAISLAHLLAMHLQFSEQRRGWVPAATRSNPDRRRPLRSRNTTAAASHRDAVRMRGNALVGTSIESFPLGRTRARKPSSSGKRRGASWRKRTRCGRPNTSRPGPSIRAHVASSPKKVHPARAQAQASVLLPAHDSPAKRIPLLPRHASRVHCHGMLLRQQKKAHGIEEIPAKPGMIRGTVLWDTKAHAKSRSRSITA